MLLGSLDFVGRTCCGVRRVRCLQDRFTFRRHMNHCIMVLQRNQESLGMCKAKGYMLIPRFKVGQRLHTAKDNANNHSKASHYEGSQSHYKHRQASMHQF